MSDQKQICPLLSVAQPVPVPCKGKECSWFLLKDPLSGEYPECALRCLAKQISIIAKR